MESTEAIRAVLGAVIGSENAMRPISQQKALERTSRACALALLAGEHGDEAVVAAIAGNDLTEIGDRLRRKFAVVVAAFDQGRAAGLDVAGIIGELERAGVLSSSAPIVISVPRATFTNRRAA